MRKVVSVSVRNSGVFTVNTCATPGIEHRRDNFRNQLGQRSGSAWGGKCRAGAWGKTVATPSTTDPREASYSACSESPSRRVVRMAESSGSLVCGKPELLQRLIAAMADLSDEGSQYADLIAKKLGLGMLLKQVSPRDRLRLSLDLLDVLFGSVGADSISKALVSPSKVFVCDNENTVLLASAMKDFYDQVFESLGKETAGHKVLQHYIRAGVDGESHPRVATAFLLHNTDPEITTPQIRIAYPGNDNRPEAEQSCKIDRVFEVLCTKAETKLHAAGTIVSLRPVPYTVDRSNMNLLVRSVLNHYLRSPEGKPNLGPALRNFQAEFFTALTDYVKNGLKRLFRNQDLDQSSALSVLGKDEIDTVLLDLARHVKSFPPVERVVKVQALMPGIQIPELKTFAEVLATSVDAVGDLQPEVKPGIATDMADLQEYLSQFSEHFAPWISSTWLCGETKAMLLYPGQIQKAMPFQEISKEEYDVLTASEASTTGLFESHGHFFKPGQPCGRRCSPFHPALEILGQVFLDAGLPVPTDSLVPGSSDKSRSPFRRFR